MSMTYYGVTMYAGNLGGDFYLNFFLLAVVEFPAKAFSIAFLDRLGRKWIHFIYMILGGSACIGTIFTVLYGGEGRQTVHFLFIYSTANETREFVTLEIA